MKKLAVLILALAMSLWLVGCTQTASIQLPFEASDVKSLELFRFSVPAQAEKKEITRQQDIAQIHAMLEKLSLKEETGDSVAGSTTLLFQFHLGDGTEYQVAYSSVDSKSGRIRITDSERAYSTSAEIEESWSQYDYEAVSVPESELPPLT